MSNTSSDRTTSKKKTDKLRVIVGEIGRDTKTGILGRGYSYDNGKTFHVTDTMFGRLYDPNDIEAIWNNGTKDRVQQEVDSATAEIPSIESTANEAVKRADSAIAASKVNSDAQVTMNSAIAEAKSTADSAMSSIQQAVVNAASDAAKIRSDVAKVQDEVNTAKTANESEVKSIQDDLKAASASIDAVKTHLESVSSDLDTYAKSAAAQGHDITIIKQKQGQFEVDYAGTKGDVNQIRADIKGLSENLKDSEGDISSLQVTAKKLQSSMSDTQGNVSNLQVTAKKYERTFEDHSGRLSKVEQTASTLTNEFSDEQGHLNRVEQTANGTKQTVANQQGQINTIKTDAAGIHETLTGQGNQIATINVTLDGLKSQYEGVSGDLDKLKNGNRWKIVKGAFDANQYTQTARIFYQDTQAKNTPNPGWFYLLVEAPRTDRITQNLIKDNSDDSWSRFYNGKWSAWTKGTTHLDIASLSDRITTNSTQITQTKKEIDLKADQDTVNNLTGEVSQTKAQLKVQAGQISSKVSSEDFKTLDNKVGGAIAQIQKNSTAIDQTDKKISLKADQTEVDKVKGTASQNSSRIDVMANEIKQKVDGTTVNNILNSKGYATMSYAQTLVKQTKDQWNVTATNLDAKIKDKDGVNLLKGTADFSGTWFRRDDGSWIDDKWLDGNGNKVRKRSDAAWNGLGQTVYLEPGNYTFSMDMYLNLGTNDSLNFYAGDTQHGGTNGIVQMIDGTHYTHSNPQARWFRAVCHFKVTKAGNVAIRPELNQGSGTVHVGSYKLEKGLIATPWSPAPSDLATVTQISNLQVSIDGIQGNVTNLKSDTSSKLTQLSNTFQSKIGNAQIAINDLKDKTLWKSTDSVNLNNTVSQQKLFVKGGSNLPPGSYWWYVQVEPGYGSRIVQYAVSDRDNKHFSRQYDGANWSAWTQDASESEITQLRDAINLRVTKGNLLSQINLAAGNTLIQSNKIYLDAGSTVFGGRAFIPSAAIKNLDASKLTFYGSGSTYATIGSSVKQYDDDKLKSTINLQYNGGLELHSSNELGSILTMHDDTIRLAVKSQVYGSGSGLPVNNQYSGVWFGNNYTLMNTVDKEGTTSGISIGVGGSVNNDYRVVLYDGSKDNRTVWGTKVGSQRFDVYTGNANLFIGPDKAEMRGKDYATVHSDNNTYIEGKNSQIHLSDGNVWIGNPANRGATGLHVTVQGWGTFSGYVEAMGWTTKSTLSSKTRIQPLDTAKALATVNATDLTTFQYKTEVAEGMAKRHAGPVIDDVHDVAQYNTPDAFVAENRQGRSDADIIGYLMGAIQELSKQLNEVKEKI